MAVLCGMLTIQYSVQSARFFKLNDLHISVSIFCHGGHVMWLNSRSSLPVSALCTICRQLASSVAQNLGRFLVWSVQATGMTLNWFQC